MPKILVCFYIFFVLKTFNFIEKIFIKQFFYFIEKIFILFNSYNVLIVKYLLKYLK